MVNRGRTLSPAIGARKSSGQRHNPATPAQLPSTKTAGKDSVSDRNDDQSESILADDPVVRMRLMLRLFGLMFTVGTILLLVGVAAVMGLFLHYSKDLPEYSQLQDYEPPVMTR